MTLKYNLDADSSQILRSHLTPNIVDNDLQGWEECTDAAMTNLLRTVLAKSTNDRITVPIPITLAPDTSKLQRHIVVVCNRISQKKKIK
jgi:Bardet-Biedl syndrome 9 protein